MIGTIASFLFAGALAIALSFVVVSVIFYLVTGKDLLGHKITTHVKNLTNVMFMLGIVLGIVYVIVMALFG